MGHTHDKFELHTSLFVQKCPYHLSTIPFCEIMFGLRGFDGKEKKKLALSLFLNHIITLLFISFLSKIKTILSLFYFRHKIFCSRKCLSFCPTALHIKLLNNLFFSTLLKVSNKENENLFFSLPN